MNNSENKKLSECESLQISVLSDDELTEELKRHLESCGECRAFLQQNSRIRDELSKLSVPDLKDGEITNRVMKEIRASKSIAFPRVRLSHHIGTAAALVIVIAIFAASKGYNFTGMIASKNDTENYQTADVTDSADSESGFTPINGVLTSPDGEKENSDNETAINEKSAQDFSDTAQDITVQTDENPTVMFSTPNSGGGGGSNDDNENISAQKRSSVRTALPESSDSVQNQSSAADNSQSASDFGGVQNGDNICGIMLSLSTSVSSQNSETDFAENSENETNDSSAAGTSQNSDLLSVPNDCVDTENGFSNSANANSAPTSNSNAIDFEDDRAGFYDSVSETYNSIFEDIEFDRNDDSLDANVTAANKYVKTIFDDAGQLRAQALTNIGITNSMFLEWIETVENPEQYSFESIYEYYSR